MDCGIAPGVAELGFSTSRISLRCENEVTNQAALTQRLRTALKILTITTVIYVEMVSNIDVDSRTRRNKKSGSTTSFAKPFSTFQTRALAATIFNSVIKHQT